ncbi:TetR/AcrR family transcriptional regulator [Streptomyces harbinensis]|uniref:DNA-binding transcriptional regulator, AcrR family n=1 Tax=Streptomyces harbinensis TaxID=1176198 RepID=A0A1I6RPX4_9ACTN|nr:TetR/AcrR family transcriptional regulator [Streptomyces harbinensis]SFS66767.1 DNA-binding transcriptional regulator, AcrR family [Streptomyces harbinensis]
MGTTSPHATPRATRGPSTPKSPDPARRNPRSQQAIFEASLDLVGKVGYEKLTIEAIAAQAGVGKQTIYRWWPSKAAVLLDAFTATVEDPDYDAGFPDTGDLAADLKGVLRATVDEFNDPAFEAPYRALAIASAGDPELAHSFVTRLSERGVQVYMDRLRTAQEAGEIDPRTDLRIATELMLSPFAQRWLTRSGPLTYAFTDALVDHALRGILTRDPGDPGDLRGPGDAGA